MERRAIFRCLRVGVVIGTLLGTLAPLPIHPHDILRVGFLAPSAYAGTIGSNCVSDSSTYPSYWSGDKFYATGAHTIWADITPDTNLYICNASHGVSAWVMVNGPLSNCVPYDYQNYALAQDGWIVGNKKGTISNLTFFYETQGVNSPYCDPGPTFIERISNTDTYKTSLNVNYFTVPPTKQAWYDIAGPDGDPYCPCLQNTDWNNVNSTQFQEFVEAHDPNTYFSGSHTDFKNILYSVDSFQHPMQPTTVRTVASTDQGASNDGHAQYVPWVSGNNSFRVCDNRVSNNGC